MHTKLRETHEIVKVVFVLNNPFKVEELIKGSHCVIGVHYFKAGHVLTGQRLKTHLIRK